MAGIEAALIQYMSGQASINFDNTAGFVLNQTGLAGAELLRSPSDTLRCGYAYSDPIDDLVTKINQIMFGLATNVMGKDINDNMVVTGNFSGLMWTDGIYYVTHQPFMWGALASILVCILCVLPVYWGYWQLGRKVCFHH